jgi:hypothetical protein
MVARVRRRKSVGLRREGAAIDAAPLKPLTQLLALALGLAALACQPEIGDSCSTSGDCSVSEQRTCDTTLPGGYCTRFGCTADDCPDESACIGFRNVLSVNPGCDSVQGRPRLQRSACMFRCERDADCRRGYSCVDMALPNAWGATVIENRGGTKVCSLLPPATTPGETQVCSSASGPVIEPLPDDAGGDDAAPPANDAAQSIDAAPSDAATGGDATTP